jgi:hypothetical protein
VLTLPPFGRGYTEIVGIVVHVYVYARITVYKFKASRSVGPLSRSNFLKNAVLGSI